MLVLAFDTTNEKGGVGIYRDSECLACVANEGPANIYSVSLFQMVDRALEQARARHPDLSTTEGRVAGIGAAPPRGLRDCDLFAVANGPGSFTGIRVGVAAAQAWGKAFGRPIRGVSVLEAMVEEARPQADWAVPILDARRGEFFLQCFRPGPQKSGPGSNPFEPEGEGWVLKASSLTAWFEERLPAAATVTCLAREHDRVTLGLRQSLSQSFQWESIPGTLVGAIARLALEAERRGIPQPISSLDAYYIRRPDAELNWRE